MSTSKGTIAPHEGREIALIREGKKPLAVIEQRKQPEAYESLVFEMMDIERDTLVIRHRLDDTTGHEVAIVRKGDGHLVDIYLASLELPESPAKHRIMGHLFGYSKEDIEAFIDNPPECDCLKCRGSKRVAA